MNLNKRDLYAYERFLNQIEMGFNDEMIDKYAKVIKNFIERYYTSSEDELFELDDFIQEGLIIIDKCKRYEAKRTFSKGLLELRLKNMYLRMKKQNEQKCLPKVDEKASYEIDSNDLEFSILLPKLMEHLKTENQKIVIEELLAGTNLKDTSKIIERSKDATRLTKLNALHFIKNSKEFKQQYDDRDTYMYTEYERFVLRCIKEKAQYMFCFNKEKLEDYWKDKVDAYSLLYLSNFFSEIQNYCSEEEYEFFKNKIEEDINKLSVKTKTMKR